MGKKIAFLMILATLCVTVLFAVSCGGGNTPVSPSWESDETHHWTSDADKAEHTFGAWETTKTATCDKEGEKTRTCSVCEYVATEAVPAAEHTFDTAWENNVTHHWHAATCEHDDEVSDYAEHNFRNGRCSVCKMEKPATAGLIYEEISTTTARVVGVEPGTKLEGVVFVADTYLTTIRKVVEIAPGAFAGQSGITSISFPSTVKTIGDGAFDGCTKLTSFTIENTVTKLGAYAFRNCTSLSEITIGTGVTKILDHTFDGCASLTSVTIPAKVTEIGAYAFNGCSKLTTVTYESTEKVKTIGARAFADCVALANVTIPTSVTKIGGSAYANTAFANSDANYEGGILYCGTYLLRAKTDITGAVTVKAGTTLVADRAFENCALMASVSTGSAVIGANVFAGCTTLGITGIVEVDDFVFINTVSGYELIAYNGTAAEVTLPANVNGVGYKIASQALAGNKTMTTVIVPDGVTEIGANAFSGCSNLVTVKMGAGVTVVGENAFSFCNAVDAIYVTDLAAWCAISFANIEAHPFNYYFEGSNNKFFVNDAEVTTLTIPETTTAIGNWAFYNCDRITTLNLGDQVKSIGIGAFRTYANGGLTTVNVNTSGWTRGEKLGGTGIGVELTADAIKGDQKYYYYIK